MCPFDYFHDVSGTQWMINTCFFRWIEYVEQVLVLFPFYGWGNWALEVLKWVAPNQATHQCRSLFPLLVPPYYKAQGPLLQYPTLSCPPQVVAKQCFLLSSSDSQGHCLWHLPPYEDGSRQGSVSSILLKQVHVEKLRVVYREALDFLITTCWICWMSRSPAAQLGKLRPWTMFQLEITQKSKIGIGGPFSFIMCDKVCLVGALFDSRVGSPKT